MRERIKKKEEKNNKSEYKFDADCYYSQKRTQKQPQTTCVRILYVDVDDGAYVYSHLEIKVVSSHLRHHLLMLLFGGSLFIFRVNWIFNLSFSNFDVNRVQPKWRPNA